MGVIRSNIAQWTRPLRHDGIRDWYENNTRMGYWRKAQINYRNRTGQSLNYKYPNDINEKLMWMERYWQHPLKTICADKYQVREYIAKHGMTDMLVPLLGVYESANQIDFAVLPNKFVLKCNHGCGYNIICLDKSKLDINETREQLSAWLKEDWDQFSCEIH